MRGQLRGLEAACAGEVHAALVARLATLETEHAALARDADAQRRQYERCLDDVANQVVRALLSQKVHRSALVTTPPLSLSLFLFFFHPLRRARIHYDEVFLEDHMYIGCERIRIRITKLDEAYIYFY